MAIPSLRRFDIQAKAALWLAVGAMVPWLAAAGASFMRYDHQLRAVQYGEGSMFKPVFFGCLGLTGLLAGLAVILGFNSAGQRRNKEEKLSWMGFFIGLAVLSLTIILFFAFRRLKFEIMATPV